jgi:hypothetical protein
MKILGLAKDVVVIAGAVILLIVIIFADVIKQGISERLKPPSF